MKTLMLLTGGLGSGGLERISCSVANHFAKNGWKVVILTLFQRRDDERSFQFLDSSIEVVPFPKSYDPVKKKKRAVLTWLKMISSSVKKHRPDALLAMTFKIGSMVSIAAPRYAKKLTVREISDPKSKARNPVMNRLTEFFCRNIKSVIFQTRWERDCFHKRIRNKGVVIPNPISIDVSETGQFAVKKMFTMTRLSIYQKRQDILIRGFAEFHKLHPEYELEIYGKGEDAEKIQSLIEEANGQDYMRICKAVPNVHQYVRDYRCFVMTSDFEGMSNALLEAYCLGIPCVSSDWPGVEDIITNGEDGLLYHRQDVGELVARLCEVAEQDGLCKRMTTLARERIDRFKYEDVIAQYCEVISGE